MAREQTSARGRRGRKWSTPRGNFSATLVMRREEEPQVAALRSFVASLALYRVFAELAEGGSSFALKWPNDVLLNGGKVAGILLESSGDYLSIGIGVNLAHAPSPDQVEVRALAPVSLQGELGIGVDAEDFLVRLAIHYDLLEGAFRLHGFEPLRGAWLSCAARLGEVITARTMHDETIGTFEDVDKDGNLILKTTNGRVAIAAADVFF